MSNVIEFKRKHDYPSYNIGWDICPQYDDAYLCIERDKCRIEMCVGHAKDAVRILKELISEAETYNIERGHLDTTPVA